jgi:hypothetical protein
LYCFFCTFGRKGEVGDLLISHSLESSDGLYR